MRKQTQTETNIAERAKQALRKQAVEDGLLALANFLDFIDTESNEELTRLGRN